MVKSKWGLALAAVVTVLSSPAHVCGTLHLVWPDAHADWRVGAQPKHTFIHTTRMILCITITGLL